MQVLAPATVHHSSIAEDRPLHQSKSFAMPSSDYTGVGGGLKLKGAKNAGVDKKRKKKSKPTAAAADEPGESKQAEGNKVVQEQQEEDKEAAGVDERGGSAATASRETSAPGGYKTEAERRHEERKRKRVRISFSFSCPSSSTHSPGAESGVFEAAVFAHMETRVARRTPEARGCQDAQGACGGTQQVPLHAQRAPRHAQNRAWIT